MAASGEQWMETITDGVEIGQYVIKGKLGAGTMGVVYAAEQLSMKRLVAIKFLPEEAEKSAEERFEREARMIARLEHPYVLPVYDFGRFGDSPFIVMRYMTGGTLLDQMARGMSRSSILRALEQIARALDYAHRQGIVHRDLKPTNIFMDERGNAYLADFGLAKTLAGTEDLTTTAEGFAGTPLYIAPEQAGGEKVDHQTDIYSLGVIAYEMLAGRPPFEDDAPLGIIMKHITAPVPPITELVPGLPPAVDIVFQWVLAKDPADRPPTAIAFVDALRLALNDSDANSDSETLRLALAGADGGTLLRMTAPAMTAATPAGSEVSVPEEAPAPTGWARVTQALRQQRRWAVVLAVVILVLALLFSVRFGLFAPGGLLSSIKVFTYPVGESPRALLYDGEDIWVANTWDNQLVRLEAGECTDIETTVCGQVLDRYPAPRAPVDITLAADSVWVIGGLGDALRQIDAATGEVNDETILPRPPSQLLSAHGFVWVSHGLDGVVSQLTLDGEVERQIEVGQLPRKMTADAEGVWVAEEGSSSLSRIDPANGEVGPTLSLPGQPLALTAIDGFLWVSLANGEVVKVNAEDGEVAARLPAGERPVALMFDGERLWVANQNSRSVTAIDVTNERVVMTVEVGGSPTALASSPCGSGCSNLWVANEADGTVTRIRLP